MPQIQINMLFRKVVVLKVQIVVVILSCNISSINSYSITTVTVVIMILSIVAEVIANSVVEAVVPVVVMVIL